MDSITINSIVHLNVGGTKYKVTRAMIESYKTDFCGMDSITINHVVHLNVGGTKYEVARAPIESYKTPCWPVSSRTLGRKGMASKSKNTRIVTRFRFVLEYMRRGQVHLPLTVGKSSLLKDLEYFGFEEAPGDAILASGTHVEAA